MRAAVVLVALSMLALAPAAHALPGDPPIAALSPKDGESVPADDAGIAVSFTCPAYTKREANELFGPEAGLLSDYEARFSRSAATGPDGRLAESAATGRVDARAGQPGICDAVLGQGGFPRPQSTPGTYFWQAARDCPSCAGGFEVGPVVRFVIRAAGAATLKAPDTAYAGYPFVVKATYAGTSGQFQLQRKAGSAWTTIARFVGDAEPIVTLARGRQTLRIVVQVGSDTVTSKTETVDVKRARNWMTAKRDDGTYRDPQRQSVKLKVTGSGKRITGFQADVPTLCANPSSTTGTSPNIARVTLPQIKIAPDGRFAFTARISGQTVRLVGRLQGRKLRDTRASITQTNCSGSIAVEARRTGR